METGADYRDKLTGSVGQFVDAAIKNEAKSSTTADEICSGDICYECFRTAGAANSTQR